MRFGPVPLRDAEGAILAHSVDLGGKRLRKGVTLEGSHLTALAAAGHDSVIVARLDADDVHENDAAAALAAALVPDPVAAGVRLTAPFTGRVNLIATGPGVAVMDAAALTAVNAVDPMITLATVPPFHQMAEGGMVATVKIISYGVARAGLDRACAVAGQGGGTIRLAKPVLQTATLIVTEIGGGLESTEATTPDKGQSAVAARLTALGMRLDQVVTVPHRIAELAEAVAVSASDLVLILTGSATSDIADVGPAALRLAGGQMERFGMPVDPGNLLFLGRLGTRPVIGLPGCARSPALNGADWVLSRIACGLAVSGQDIAAMGIGGLLKEIPTRPMPRAGRGRDSKA
ncbi:MAG: molybdopterin-binding protein [Paracoccaceae bacterium]|uniref:molybdopterin-binding protein n=1 Tax=Seohaeicola saemankumensis TaxID=481181 RepID=UPI001E43D9A1|nr:molybdopterin-binding protein [Seohaeicola saemankumensis]MCD1626342.1 molybdopterin-binding protein [Seohaeicola saemankumensis]